MNLSHEVMLNVVYTASLHHQFMEKTVLKHYGLTKSRLNILFALHEHPDGLVQKELAHHIFVTAPNLSGLVGRMAKEGLILRQATDDRREKKILLTEKGREIADELRSRGPAILDIIVGHLSDSEKVEFTRLNEKIRQGILEAEHQQGQQGS